MTEKTKKEGKNVWRPKQIEIGKEVAFVAWE